MFYKILKRIYYLFWFPIRKTNKTRTNILNLYISNIKPILKRKVIFRGIKPNCQQKTLFTGLGIISIGEKCFFGFKMGGFHRGGSIEFQARTEQAKIIIGNNVATNNNIFLCAANYIEIGDDTLIGQNVTIMDHEAHGISPDARRQVGKIGEVRIGSNVWIGNNVTILKNSEIGDNSIIATGAVVSGKFSENIIIGGIPAKKIKDL